MSYILDALTKAAQQRDRRIPVVQRLLAPVTRAPRLPWTRSLSRLFVALAVNAGLLVVLTVWWLRPVPVAEPPDPAPAASAPTARSTLEPPRSAVEPPRVAVELPRSVPEPPRAVVEPPRSAVAATPAPVVVPQAHPPVPPATPQRPSSPPQPAPVLSAPLTPVGPGTPQSQGALRLEALIYSDVPSQRMVFINGRRYVEGDLVEGRLRVEEIHEGGVDLSEQGRRTTLRATR